MAYEFTDGMDTYAAASDLLTKYNSATSLTFLNVSATAGRFGGGCITSVNTTSLLISKIVSLHGTATPSDEFFLGWSGKLTAYPGTVAVMAAFVNEASALGTWQSTDADTNLTLRITSAGLLAIYRGTTLLATGTTALPLNSWHRLEVRIVVATSGIFEVRLNGVAEITFSGDTYDAGEAGVRQFAFYGVSNANGFSLDDIICWNSVPRSSEVQGWIGDIKIETLRPVANGDVVDSIPLTGAAWDMVNDTVSDGDATYTQAGAVSNKDLYQCSDLSSTPDAVWAVIVNAQMKTTGTTSRRVILKVKHTNEGPTNVKPVPLGTYGLLQECFPYDPADFGDWTGADVNAMQIGWEVDT